MTRVMRISMLALVVAAILGGIFRGTRVAEAGNGYEQLVEESGTGCLLYWDGYAYTWSACPRTDGGFDWYLPSYGQWVFTFSTGWNSDGSVWLYYQGQYYFAGGY